MQVMHPSILRLVCGLPSPKRGRRLLMSLQAYVDDSMTDGEVLVLAGYISTAERWAAFSEEWQQILDMRPRMTKLHMADVDLKSDLQMERVRFFFRVIEDHVIAGTAIALNLKELAAADFHPSVPAKARLPYMMAFKAIIDNTIQQQHKIYGLDGPIDFIFDKRSEQRLVQSAYETYGIEEAEEYRRLIGRTPIFEDDEEFLPLQAADFLAWWTRRTWIEQKTIAAAIGLPVHRFTKPHQTIFLDVAGDDLRRDIEQMNEMYSRQQSVFQFKSNMTVNFSIDLSGGGHDPSDA